MGTETWFIFLRRPGAPRLLAASDGLTPRVADVVRDAVAAAIAAEPISDVGAASVEVRSSSDLRESDPAALIVLAGEWRQLKRFSADRERNQRSFFWDVQRDEFYRCWGDELHVTASGIPKACAVG